MEDGRDRAQTDRRSFLSGLAALGGAGLATTAASPAESQPPGGRRKPRRPGVGAPMGPGIRRANGKLTLASDPVLVKAGPAIPQDAPALKAPVPSGRRPSSRARIISALAATASGNALLGELGIGFQRPRPEGSAVTAAPSQDLGEAMQQSLVARALASGITLTPAGCEYDAGAAIPNEDPLSFHSRDGYIDTGSVRDQRARVHANYTMDDRPILHVLLTTPGTMAESLIYVLELSVTGAPATDFRGEANQQGFDFYVTSDDTLMALASYPGCDDGPPNSFGLIQTGMLGAVIDFEWLNVVAL